MSTNFIYGIQKALCGHESKGMYLADACKIVKTYGDMTHDNCPGNKEIPWVYGLAEIALEDKEKKDDAYYYRIDSYYKCETDDDIKYALMNCGPVLACVEWHKKYNLALPSGLMTFDTTSDKSYHAVFIYGWNEKGWLCQNSWGENWGNHGRMIIRPEDITEARAMIDHDNLSDDVVVIPKRNAFLDVCYKVCNFIINLFKKN